MTAKFCGNPRNHDAHEFEYAVDADHGMVPLMAWCDGVGVEEYEKTVEKYDPTEQAMDGTRYSEITITIKDADGNVTTIQVDKAAHVNFELLYQKYVPLVTDWNSRPPRIEQALLTFEPYQHSDNPIIIT